MFVETALGGFDGGGGFFDERFEFVIEFGVVFGTDAFGDVVDWFGEFCVGVGEGCGGGAGGEEAVMEPAGGHFLGCVGDGGQEDLEVSVEGIVAGEETTLEFVEGEGGIPEDDEVHAREGAAGEVVIAADDDARGDALVTSRGVGDEFNGTVDLVSEGFFDGGGACAGGGEDEDPGEGRWWRRGRIAGSEDGWWGRVDHGGQPCGDGGVDGGRFGLGFAFWCGFASGAGFEFFLEGVADVWFVLEGDEFEMAGGEAGDAGAGVAEDEAAGFVGVEEVVDDLVADFFAAFLPEFVHLFETRVALLEGFEERVGFAVAGGDAEEFGDGEFERFEFLAVGGVFARGAEAFRVEEVETAEVVAGVAFRAGVTEEEETGGGSGDWFDGGVGGVWGVVAPVEFVGAGDDEDVPWEFCGVASGFAAVALKGFEGDGDPEIGAFFFGVF